MRRDGGRSHGEEPPRNGPARRSDRSLSHFGARGHPARQPDEDDPLPGPAAFQLKLRKRRGVAPRLPLACGVGHAPRFGRLLLSVDEALTVLGDSFSRLARELRLDRPVRGHDPSLSARPGAMAWGEERHSGGGAMSVGRTYPQPARTNPRRCTRASRRPERDGRRPRSGRRPRYAFSRPYVRLQPSAAPCSSWSVP